MNLEHAFEIAGDAAKIAPAVTAIFAGVAVVMAIRTLRAQKSIAQKRAAIDFFLKTEMDKEMLCAYGRYRSAVVALNSAASLDEFEKTDQYGALRSYLNIHELIAVGIRRKVFDNSVCYNFWCAELTRACTESQRIIDFVRRKPNEASTYWELRRLNERWSMELEKWRRKQKVS
jgi:hypothetical protein